MVIDTDFILRQARELQRLELTRARAREIAQETMGLVVAAFAATAGVEFEDAPEQFLAVLSELREQ